MRKLSYLATIGLVSALALTVTSCDDEDPEPATVTVDSSQPSGALTVVDLETEFTPESGKPTTGSASIVTDANGDYFVRLDEDFSTDFGTGTVSIFLAKSAEFQTTGDGVGSQRVVGFVNSGGETFFKLEGAPAAAYTHVILWCGTVGIPFGNAQVQ